MTLNINMQWSMDLKKKTMIKANERSFLKQFAKVFLIVDLVVVIFCLIQGEMLWLLNTQVAFFSSLLIVIGSYFGYKRNIEKRIDNSDLSNLKDTPDTYDKLDDKFDLYSEINEEEDLSKEKIKEIIVDEKQKLKNQSNIKNTIKSFGGASSIYRLFGYVTLVIGFFYLNNNQLLEPVSYLIGFIIVPVATLATRFITK